MQTRTTTAGVTPERTVLCFTRGIVGGSHDVDSLNEFGQTRRHLDVCIGSQADLFADITPTAGSGGKADANGTVNPGDCF